MHPPGSSSPFGGIIVVVLETNCLPNSSTFFIRFSKSCEPLVFPSNELSNKTLDIGLIFRKKRTTKHQTLMKLKINMD